MKPGAHGMLDAKDGTDVLNQEQRSAASHDSSEQDEPQPAKKRARPTQKASKPHKKYVRGQQGSLKGLMQMPIDIFAEIVNHLNPGDLVALTRSNKFFRKLLLHRSAIQMWRYTESNVPGLPPCPPDMCEPQYAALLFSKHCTFCGANTTAKPDVYLRVRPCATCRENELRSETKPWSFQSVPRSLVDSSPIIKNKYRRQDSREPFCCLKRQVDEVLDTRREFHDAGDHYGLEKWEEERRTVVSTRRQYGLQLTQYLDSVGKSRDRELGDVKQQRREAIVERLKGLGWMDEDMSFSESDGKPWRAIVDTPKPLTDRIWDNIVPKLIPLLEENRKQHIAQAMAERRLERRKHIGKFLEQMKSDENPLEPILNALDVHPPPPPQAPFHPGGILFPGPGMHPPFLFPGAPSFESFEFEIPFPNTSFALTWDCLVDLSERDTTIEEVQAELEARRAQIGQKVLEWRANVEKQLVKRFKGDATDGENVVLTVGGSTKLTSQLSRDFRLLLRADTIFKRIPPLVPCFSLLSIPQDKSHSSYYPQLVSDEQGFSYPRPFTPLGVFEPEANAQDFDPSTYQRHTELEKIVKPLLKDLGMSDVTRIELHALKTRFVCGRCGDKTPKTWDQLVGHYTHGLNFWARNSPPKTLFPTRHPIVYKNEHDLETQVNSKPLAKLLTEQESHHSLNPPLETGILGSGCLICYMISVVGWRPMDLNELVIHMQDVHDVSAPVEGVHYGPLTNMDRFNLNWYKEWDLFHNAQIASSSSTGTLTLASFTVSS